MIDVIERYPKISLMLFVLLMLGFSIDSIPLSIMEARNFITAREMLSDHNWILTTFNGEARYEKPPLPTWLTAIFGYAFGIQSLLALRWPALLCLGFLGIGVFSFAKALSFKNEMSVIIGFVALTSFYIISIIVEAPWDIYTHTFMLWAILLLYKILKSEHTSYVHYLGFSLLLAASILSKGPIGIYALFLPFLIAYGIVYKFKGFKSKWFSLLLSIVFGLLLGASWYIYVRYADPETFIQITSKETSNWSSYNVKPFYYYWSFFLQSGLWAILALTGLFYPYLKSRVSNLKAYKLTLLWTLIAVILLSLIPEKKSRYLMPVLVPLAINSGFYIEFLINHIKKSSSFIQKLPVYVTFGIPAVACVLPLVLFIFTDIFSDELSLTYLILISISFTCLGLLIFIRLFRWYLKSLFYLSFTLFLLLGTIVLPALKQKLQNEKLIDSIPIKTNLTVYSLDKIAPEVIFYYEGKIPRLTQNDLASSQLPNSFILYTKSNQQELLDSLIPNHRIKHLKTIDLNYGVTDGKGKRNRLVNEVYKITKAETSLE